jgi:hypothetical protein
MKFSQDFGLVNYLDALPRNADRIVISMESLDKLFAGNVDRYDVLILDELTCILKKFTSKTIRNPKCYNTFLNFLKLLYLSPIELSYLMLISTNALDGCKFLRAGEFQYRKENDKELEFEVIINQCKNNNHEYVFATKEVMEYYMNLSEKLVSRRIIQSR